MAATSILEIETHPDGTVGVNAIITSNWDRLEEVFGAPSSQATTGSTALDFSTSRTKDLDGLTGDITFTTSNLKAGRRATVRIVNGGTLRNFTFPGGWVFTGAAAPASIAVSKTAILHLESFGTTDADVVATYSVEP